MTESRLRTKQIVVDSNYSGSQSGTPIVGDDLNVVIAKLYNKSQINSYLGELTTDPVSPLADAIWMLRTDVASAEIKYFLGGLEIVEEGIQSTYTLKFQSATGAVIEFKPNATDDDSIKEYENSNKPNSQIGEEWVTRIIGSKGGNAQYFLGGFLVTDNYEADQLYLRVQLSDGIYQTQMSKI